MNLFNIQNKKNKEMNSQFTSLTPKNRAQNL